MASTLATSQSPNRPILPMRNDVLFYKVSARKKNEIQSEIKKSEHDGKEREKRQNNKEEKQTRKESIGPIGWKILLAIVLSSAGFLAWFEYEKKKQLKKFLESKTQSVGKPMVGGPFNLVDENKIPITEKSFAGKYAILYFGFTNCPDICPTEIKKMERTMKILKLPTGVELVPVFISVDPQRDTPERLQAYKKNWSPYWKWLTGTEAEIGKIAKSFRLYYSVPETEDDDYLVDHSIFFYLLDREGNMLEYYGRQVEDVELATRITVDIEKDLKKQGGK